MKKDERRVHVVVCIPSSGQWQADFGLCLAQLVSYFSTVRVPGTTAQKLSVVCTQSSMLCSNREELVKTALREKATHMLFLDTDMKFPKQILHGLLPHNKPFIGANCTTRSYPPKFTSIGLDESEVITTEKSTGLEEVKQNGLAVALIETKWIKQFMKPPLFYMQWTSDAQTYMGEDVFFTRKWKRLTGKPVYIDHDLSKEIYHIGNYAYGAHLVEAASMSG